MRRFLTLSLAAGALAAVVLPAAIGAQARATPSASAPASRPAGMKEWLGMIPKGTFQPRPKYPPPKLPEKIERAFVIPLRRGINKATADIIKHKIAACKGRAQIVIFDVNSPGGELEAMRRIVDLIRNDLADVYTVAYVNPEAISAAAIISMACDEIVMSTSGKIGDAMPVMVGPQGYVPIPREERGKIESYTRADIRVEAERSGYNVALCEAMITLTREIWLVRNPQTGELRIVDARDYRNRVLGAPVDIVETLVGVLAHAVKPGAPTTAPAAAQDGPWEFLALIDASDELVTMTAEEAVALGFARHVIEMTEGLRIHYNIVTPLDVLEDNPLERVVTFLTSPLATMFLFTAALFCLYTELRTPGFGVFGLMGIFCFALLFGSRYLIGFAQWWEIGLFLLGLVLLAVEIFLIPGFGFVGIAGMLCCIIALAAMLVANPPDKLPIPTTDLDWSMFEKGVLAFFVGFLLAIAGAAALTRFLPKVPVANKLVLVPAKLTGGGPVSESAPIGRVKVGNVGTVEGMCRPVGKVRFGNDLLDAASQGEIIEVGTKVRVLRRDGNRVVVEKTEGGQ